MRTVALSFLAIVAVIAIAAPPLAASKIDWEATTPASGEVVDNELRIEGTGTHLLVTISDPDITGDSYSIAGEIRFDAVGEAGYLEMWSYFADGGAYYSRTLDDSGPMAPFVGNSDGRAFEVPFFLNGAAGPDRVELSLVLADGGTVWISPLDLVGFNTGDAWWSESQAGIVGAAGGILAGLSGAALGLLSRKQKSRRLVVGMLIGGAIVGSVLLVVTLAALIDGQPRHVWYPLGLFGLILAVVDGLLIPTMRKTYAAAELQRMRALDA